MGRAEGEGERASQANSTLSSEANAELNLMTLRSQPELKPRVRCLTDCATQVPLYVPMFKVQHVQFYSTLPFISSTFKCCKITKVKLFSLETQIFIMKLIVKWKV